MYAQLCKRLSEEAPNFEPPGQPCTFKLLLLNKCRTEFENRAQAFAAFEDKTLTPDEEEKRHLAKCKMLGNIKFIGELGKLEILAESILHRCIQNLLARRAAAEQHEDLECLAQLVRTCGRVLDSERGRGLMDQYFARIETLSHARELAPRIRFMLRDVVELRRGGWQPRAAAAAAAEGPVPIHQLRGDDDSHGGGGGGRREREHRDRERERDAAMFRGGMRSRPLDDVLAGLSLQPAASFAPPSDKLFGNGFAARDRDRDRDAYRQRSAPGGGYYGSRQHHHGGGGGGGGGKQPAAASRGDAARGNKRLAAGGGALADLQMRPAANSLLFSATRQARDPPPSALQPIHNVLAPTQFAAPPPLLKEPPLAIAIKPAQDGKHKPKKDKGTDKEEACRLLVEAVEALAADGGGGGGEGGSGDEREPAAGDAPEPVRRLLALQLPDKALRRATAAALEHALTAAVAEGEARARAACYVVRCVKRAPVADALRALVAARAGGEAAAPVPAPPAPAAPAEPAPAEPAPAEPAEPAADSADSAESAEGEGLGGGLPALLAHAVRHKLVALGEVGGWCEGGQHHPLLLQVLQRLKDLVGLERLHRLYDESKINLCAYVASAEGGGGGGGGGAEPGGQALDALEARGLAALVPQLRVQAQLARQLAQDPQPAQLYRWIKANVEPSVRHNAAFVSTLVALVARHVTGAASSAAAQPEKAALEREKALAEGYAPLLTALLEGRPDLQLAAVYAVQVHAHHHRYPKGLLLRWFMYLYNLEVCEEDAFLRWREDVTDAYPGKGEALFQVNTWLTWLQQQESEDEEAED